MKTLLLTLLLALTLNAGDHMTFEEARTEIYKMMGKEKPVLGLTSHVTGGFMHKVTKAKIDAGFQRRMAEHYVLQEYFDNKAKNTPEAKAEAKRLKEEEAIRTVYIHGPMTYGLEL